MHAVNTHFGHLDVLARYVGEPVRPALGYIQHGWYEIGPMDAEPRLPWVPELVWNRRNLADARRFGATPATAIGAPRLYLGDLPPATGATGTIAYPAHAWDPEADRLDDDPAYRHSHESYAADLLEREGEDVTVALYWKDHEQESARRAYQAKGFRVVSHGTRDEPRFLDRQRDELRRHRRAVTNQVSSALFYAGADGLELEVYGTVTGYDDGALIPWCRRFHREHFPELFAGPVQPDDARALAAAELGAEFKREPEELAVLLGWRGVRRLVAPAVDLVDRAQYRFRVRRHDRWFARQPVPWRSASSGGSVSSPA